MGKKKKREMNVPRFILILNGPSCAGKSSISQYFHSEYKNIFCVKGDKIRWMISDYNHLNLKHKKNVQKMVQLLIEYAIKQGFSIVQDWSITNKQRIRYNYLAKKHHLNFLEVNLETNFKIISERFGERIRAAKKGAKISLVDPKIMKERYEDYFNSKNINLPTFDSGKLSSKQISKKIIKILKK